MELEDLVKVKTAFKEFKSILSLKRLYYSLREDQE